MAQKLRKYERYYGKKLTKDTPTHELKNAVHEAKLPPQELEEAIDNEELMANLINRLNRQDKRVEVCKNYSKAQVLEKLKELQATANLFESYST